MGVRESCSDFRNSWRDIRSSILGWWEHIIRWLEAHDHPLTTILTALHFHAQALSCRFLFFSPWWEYLIEARVIQIMIWRWVYAGGFDFGISWWFSPSWFAACRLYLCRIKFLRIHSEGRKQWGLKRKGKQTICSVLHRCRWALSRMLPTPPVVG